MTTGTALLLVDDDELTLNRTLRWLRMSGYPATGAPTYDRARRLLDTEPFALLLTKAKLGAFSGVRLMQLVYLDHPDTGVIVMGDQPDSMLQIEARRYGALYATVPRSREELIAVIARVRPELRPQQRWPRKRLPAPVPVRVRQQTGTLVDVSYGGLCFEIPRSVQLPGSYEVALDWLGVHVLAQTIWSATSAGALRCGAMLVTPQPGDHARWRMLVDLLPEQMGN
jgi:ActR/RegA family two-component response regulator